jgi:hypothetical protein
MSGDSPTGPLPGDLIDPLRARYAARPFSLIWEVRTLLSLGLISLSSGLGIWVYRNIGTLGHRTVLAAIALGAAGCFAYCFLRAPAFTRGKAPSAIGIEYLLWLGALLTGVFSGYLQARYAPFGAHTAAAVALPAAFYLALAYRFDHLGVLHLGIAGLCAAAGVALAPGAALRTGGFDPRLPSLAGLILAGVYGIMAWVSDRRELKPHFAFAYGNAAAHLFFLSALGGMAARRGAGEAVHFALAFTGAALTFRIARGIRSPYFALVAVAYGYLAVTFMAFRHVFTRGWAQAELGMLYFLASCAAAIWLFRNLKVLAGKSDAGV